MTATDSLKNIYYGLANLIFLSNKEINNFLLIKANKLEKFYLFLSTILKKYLIYLIILPFNTNVHLL